MNNIQGTTWGDVACLRGAREVAHLADVWAGALLRFGDASDLCGARWVRECLPDGATWDALIDSHRFGPEFPTAAARRVEARWRVHHIQRIAHEGLVKAREYIDEQLRRSGVALSTTQVQSAIDMVRMPTAEWQVPE